MLAPVGADEIIGGVTNSRNNNKKPVLENHHAGAGLQQRFTHAAATLKRS